jgi:hypothetical protein
LHQLGLDDVAAALGHTLKTAPAAA